MQDKLCPKCKKIKPRSKFWKDRRRADGLQSYCISCQKNRYKTEDYRSWQRDRTLSPVHKQALNAARFANKRAKEYGINRKISVHAVLAVWERDKACLKCGGGLGLDHVVPLSRGGLNILENLQTLCSKCNSSKMQKIRDYRERQTTPLS